MFESLKQLFQGGAPAPEWPAIRQWAQARGGSFRRAREGAGFVVEAGFEGQTWRLEWGPSQRIYLSGHELRLRMELDLPGSMQMLILSRGLMQAMESETFERYIDDTKTQIDTSTPEEMRWLVMHPKLSLKPLPALRPRVAAVGEPAPCLARWIEGPLAGALESAVTEGGLLGGDRPFVLMGARNRVMLRVALEDPQPVQLDQALALFEVAVSQTPQAVEGLGVTPSEWARASGWQSRWHDDGGPDAPPVG